MKKLLVIAALAAVGYVVYQQIAAAKAEQDLWTEATSAPDLR
ncbi:DLW-39 family protein [Longivirga aurantiaca]|uniref:DLW-39 family protein n=1 Tax=Longivirga aurantiaca TaxID=1837743 RepID=A0ABW1T482_9ACTN